MTASYQLRFAPADLPLHSEGVGIRLERRALGDRAVLLAYPAGSFDESTHARYVCEMALRGPDGVVAGTGQLLITPHRVLGFVSSDPLGSLLEGGAVAVHGFSIDRQTLETFRVKVNWRSRAIGIAFEPKRNAASFVVEVSAATLALDADGTTTGASLDSVVKSFDRINWTTTPSAEAPAETRPSRASEERLVREAAPSAASLHEPNGATPPALPSAATDFRMLRVHKRRDEGDGLLYPVTVDGSAQIGLDDADGNPLTIAAKGMALSRFADGTNHQLASYLNQRVDVTITNARLAVACVEWNKGHRERSTAIIHVAGAQMFNALDNKGRQLKEAREREGAVLVGHARYSWVTAVSFGGLQTKRTLQQLRIDIRRLEGDQLFLSIYFDREVDLPALVRQIVARVAAYRLKNTKQDERTRGILASAAAGPPALSPTKEKLAHYPIPGACGATPETSVSAGG